jgi:hypothetical protein
MTGIVVFDEIYKKITLAKIAYLNGSGFYLLITLAFWLILFIQLFLLIQHCSFCYICDLFGACKI